MNDIDPRNDKNAAPTDRSPDQFKDASPRAEAPPPPPDPFSFDDDGFDEMFARKAAPKNEVPKATAPAPPPQAPPATETPAPNAAAPNPDKEPATWRSKSQPPPDETLSQPRRSLDLRRGEPSRRRTPIIPPAPSREPPAQADTDHQNIAEIAPIATDENQSPGEAPSRALSSSHAKSQTPAPTPTVEEIQNQIHDLEARLDHLIQKNRQERIGPASEATAASSKGRDSTNESEKAADSVTARELLSTDFYLRKWGRIGMKNRSEEVDEFGLDPKYESRYIPFFDFLHKYYFRVDTQGIENIPETGRGLIVSNHSGGTLPYDGVMLRTIVRREHPKARELRWLSEDCI